MSKALLTFWSTNCHKMELPVFKFWLSFEELKPLLRCPKPLCPIHIL